MNCTECQERLQALLDGEAHRPAEVEAHLAGCAECRGLDTAARRLQGALRLATPPAPPADLRQRITLAVCSDQRGRRRLRRGVFLAAACGVAASLLVGLAGLPAGSGRPSHVAQAWTAVREFFFGPTYLDLTDIDLAPDAVVEVVPERETQAGASLSENMAEATSAVASLARRTADETVSNGQLLVPPVTLPMPDQQSVASPLDPPAESLRQAGRGVAVGLEPVTSSVGRALDLFRRDIAPMAPDAKPGL
jgi:predicted anti-sigma-YlaC factor YlaD